MALSEGSLTDLSSLYTGIDAAGGEVWQCFKQWHSGKGICIAPSTQHKLRQNYQSVEDSYQLLSPFQQSQCLAEGCSLQPCAVFPQSLLPHCIHIMPTADGLKTSWVVYIKGTLSKRSHQTDYCLKTEPEPATHSLTMLRASLNFPSWKKKKKRNQTRKHSSRSGLQSENICKKNLGAFH